MLLAHEIISVWHITLYFHFNSSIKLIGMNAFMFLLLGVKPFWRDPSRSRWYYPFPWEFGHRSPTREGKCPDLDKGFISI